MVCLRYLYLEQTSITKLPSPIGNLMGLACLEVGNCKYLKDIECFVDLQLPERCVDLDCLRFSLCAVIAFGSVGHSLQVKCTYRFHNKHGESRDLVCYLHGWYDEKRINSAHILVGFDPCVVAKEDYMFSEYSEVSVEFQPEFMNGNLLPFDLCQVHECGVRLLYEDGTHRFDLIRSDYFCFYPMNGDEWQTMFQAKRARFQGMRWEDYYVMCRTYEFLADLQLPDVVAGPSSFCLPGDTTPEWFSHQSWGSTVTFQLSSNWANSEFLGFSLCAVIAFGFVPYSFDSAWQRLHVKCTYHFRNKHGDSRDLDCYLHGFHDLDRDLHGLFDEKRIDSTCIFMGFDPCVDSKENDTFCEYSEVSVEFHLENNLFHCCHVIECGVHLLYDGGAFGLHLLHANDEDKIQRFHLILSDSSRFYPLDQDELEGRFQAKRARFQADRWEDYFVMRRTYEFLADLQLPDVVAEPSSFCLPGDATPEWFSHQSWGSTVTFQLSSHSANSEFLGFSLCVVIASYSFNFELQVKCTYHFRNEHGDSHDLYCYLHGWYDEKRMNIFMGFDPCVVAKEKDTFSEYSEVSIEFQLEDKNGNLLPLDLCQVVECGVRLLHANEIYRFDFIMQRYYRFYPQDQDGLEAMFQAKRARLQVNRQDYSIMYRTYEFLADLQLPDVPARPFSFCLPMPPSFCLPRPPSFCPRPPSFYLPGDITPEWFSHKSWGSTVTFQLSSQWANSEFLGFSLCAVIVSSSFNFELQVKCTYHFRNKHGDSRDLYCYLDGWFDDKGNDPAHIFVGLDPCLVAKEKDTFSKYSEVSVEFQPEDMNGTLLLSDFCQVVECGVHLLHANEMDHFDFSMQDDSCFHPPDRDELKAVFQAKRERFVFSVSDLQMGLLCSSSPLLQVAPSMSKGRPATELRCGEESRPPATRAVRYPLDRETGPWLAASVEETPLQGWSGGDEEDSEAAAGGLGSVEAGPATSLWGGEKWGMEALRLLKGPVEEGKQKLREVAVWLGQPAGEEEEEK
uniref:C-JID domain-containing protein n=1 Tax=Populus alba TaxID=43335 RepID=A0A4U5NLD2_POPAL|nr:hypothetical protein D5086_0000257390 [Populus alba]